MGLTLKYNYALKDNVIALKDIDKKTKEEVESEIPTDVILHDKVETVSAYMLDFIDTEKYPVFRYYLQQCSNKAVVYLNDKDVYPVTVRGNKYYISDYSKLKLIAFPEHKQPVYPESHTYLKDNSLYNTNSTDKEAVNPVPELMDNVLTNVYSDLAKMKSDYDKGKVPESSEYYENALKQLQRLKLWG